MSFAPSVSTRARCQRQGPSAVPRTNPSARGMRVNSASFHFGPRPANASGIDVAAGRLNLQKPARRKTAPFASHAVAAPTSHRGRRTDKTGRDLQAEDASSSAAKGSTLRRRAFTSILSAAPSIRIRPLAGPARTGHFAHHRNALAGAPDEPGHPARRRLTAALPLSGILTSPARSFRSGRSKNDLRLIVPAVKRAKWYGSRRIS